MAIFLAFVVLVGPGDWFVLGWLRAGRYTWLLFPALAIGCTWTTVAVARHYLGASDRVQRLEIVDLGSGGQTLRHNRFGRQFAGTGHRAAKLHDTLWADLVGADPNERFQRYRGGYNPGLQDDDGAEVATSATIGPRRGERGLPGRALDPAVEADPASRAVPRARRAALAARYGGHRQIRRRGPVRYRPGWQRADLARWWRCCSQVTP